MTAVVNPASFTIVDSRVAADKVTGFNIKFGQTAGGPYPLVAPVPASDLGTLASGTVQGTMASLSTLLAPGDWFAVATAVNAAGESVAVTAEQQITISQPLPGAPDSLTFS